MISNEEIMVSIQQLNPTATLEFLKQFSRQELKAYLSRLLETIVNGDQPAKAA